MTIKCHFDGKVFIPAEPVDLPVGQVGHVTTETGPHGATIPATVRAVVDVSDEWSEEDLADFAKAGWNRASHKTEDTGGG